MSTTRLNVTLEQYEIGLSGAVPDRKSWSEPAMDRAILEFVALFSGIVLKYGGRIVHGSHPTFTPVILRQARLHAGKRSRKPVTLVMSELWAKAYSDDDLSSLTDIAELVVTRQIGEGGIENAQTRNNSLSAMRRVLIDSQNTMVAVGGKMHSADGIIPGVQEEMDMASRKNLPRFLLAGLGGYARQYAQDLIPEQLDNGLNREQNTFLFSTDDVAACVNVLFEHLVSERGMQSRDQPVRWNPENNAVLDHRDGSVEHESTGYLLHAQI